MNKGSYIKVMNKVDPYRMYKFGKTTSEDILERFDEQTHYRLGWRATPLSRDYEIKPLWSMWLPKERAVLAENWFKRTYPKKFISQTDYNGITECRNWTEEESRAFYSFLNEKYPKTEQYWKEINQLKSEGKLGSSYEKVYYIMLVRK